MNYTEALLWVVGIVGSVMAGAITLDKVLDIIHKYIKKAQAPDAEQNKRLDKLEERLNALESSSTKNREALNRDLMRFEKLDEVMRLNLRSVRNLLEAQLTGDNVAQMQACKEEIDDYLVKGLNTWKQS